MIVFEKRVYYESDKSLMEHTLMTEETIVQAGHCMRCKEKREMKDVEEVEMKNGRKAIKGLCATCGTKMFKILGNKK